MWRLIKAKIKDHLPFLVLTRLYYLYCLFLFFPRTELNRRRAKLPLLNAVNLFTYKSSDVLFILGSGSSINKISQDRWMAISNADTIGLNFWPYHRFVPKIYFYESTPAGWPPDAEYLRLIAIRAHDYVNTLKITTDMVQPGHLHIFDYPDLWMKNHYAAFTVPAAARTDQEFGRALQYLISKGLFRQRNRVLFLFKHCGTISTLVSLGAIMNYKKIVLCGVDLKDSYYFYQDRLLYPDSANMEFTPKGSAHPTMTRHSWGNVPINVVLSSMKKKILQPNGIELYVEHTDSALWPEVPVAPQELYDGLLPSHAQ